MLHILRIAAIASASCGLTLLAWESVEPWHIPESEVTGPKNDLETLSLGLASFTAVHGHSPTQAEGLSALVSAGMLRRIPSDRWGNKYIYANAVEAPGFKIHSAGANGVDEHGGGDDIVNWNKAYSCTDYREFCLTTKAAELSRSLLIVIALLSLACTSVAATSVAWQRVRAKASAA